MKRLLPWLQRRWPLFVVLAGFIILAAFRFAEIKTAFATLIHGQGAWILAAALLQMVYYIVYSNEYALGFATVEIQSSARELLPVLFAAIFIKAIVPSGGVSGLAVFVDDAARRGQSGARAAEGALLVLVADLLAAMPLIIIGLVELSIRHVLLPYQTVTVQLFVLFAALLGSVILLGYWLPGQLHGLLAWAQEAINRLAGLSGHHPVLPEGWADEQAGQYIGAARGLTEHPRLLGYTLGVALAGQLINLASLGAIALAYQQRLGPGALAAAFAMDMVFSVISIIPHGMGVVEGVMVLVFASLGVNTARAMAITVAFRGLNVWLPLVIGFFFLHNVRSFGAERGR